MRILIVASWYRSAKAPVRGGFIREQALALARRGHTVDVAFVDPDTRRLPLSVEHIQHNLLREISIAAPWPLHRAFGFYMPQPLVWRLRRVISDVRPQIVHAHAVRPAGVMATRAAIGLQLPIVLTEHKGDLATYWASWHGWNQMRMAYESCARLFAVSQALKTRLESCFPSTRDRWAIAYNGIDLETFRVEPDRKPAGAGTQRRILFLGGLTQRKGLPTLLEALHQLPAEFSLTVGGPGATSAEVSRLAQQYGVTSRVRSVGLVDRQRIVALLNTHEVLAVPSYSESFGLVCAEALACGTPVVATRCGGPEEIVSEPFGRIVEPYDTTGFAEALLGTCSSLASWRPDYAHAHIRQNFSIDAIAAQLEREYEQLL